MMKVLYIAFACEPGQGSEPGVGWNFAARPAGRYQAWILTDESHRRGIEAYLRQNPGCNLRVVYCSLPKWQKFLVRFGGFNLHYYLWHRHVARVARALNERERFDLVHHVTYARYWMPSAARTLNVPYIWGPVGGAEDVSWKMLMGTGWRLQLSEMARSVVRRVFEWHPATRQSIRRAAVMLAGTEQTARRLRELGARRVELVPMIGCEADDVKPVEPSGDRLVRFASAGRLLGWKGFELGLRAFAAAKLENARYILIGAGPERRRLARVARQLGIDRQVEMTGGLSREECLRRLGQSDVLIHPSLHDSGGYICMEALCMGKPVVCLDVGGPAIQVNSDCGIKISPTSAQQVVSELAGAMRQLAGDPALRRRMGQSAQRFMLKSFTWDRRMVLVEQLYRQVLAGTRTRDDAKAQDDAKVMEAGWRQGTIEEDESWATGSWHATY